MSASSGWWFSAVVFGRIRTDEHPDYQAASRQMANAPYLPSRLKDIREQSELSWKMSDEGLLRIHDRMDKLLTTCLAIFGLVVSAMQIGKVDPTVVSYAAVLLLVLACTLLLLSRLPIVRFAPTDLYLIVGDSVTIDPNDEHDWSYQMAVNYYLARIENDIAARVLGIRMGITIGLLVLALLLLVVAI